MNRTSLFVIFCILVPLFLGLATFKDKNLTNTRLITISSPDSVVHARILITKSQFKADPEKSYYWYVPECINVNQGGFSGYLLHGDYSVYDNNQHLIVKGTFTKGLKTGTWERWHSSGKLSEKLIWKKGIPDGNARYFDEEGSLIKEVNMKRYKKEKHFGRFRKSRNLDTTSDSLSVPVDSNVQVLIR